MLQVAQEGRARLIQDGAVTVVVRHDRAMPIPVADALAHRVGPVEQLHEADVALQQPAGEDAVAREAGLGRIGVIGAVALESRR